ncbi:DUF6415 family natural product biosynthesis protein [Streptomyces albireticuli]|nr:DUF6415 family natural product biosynthesis protein [Streptomyces albireticuli]
MTRAHDDSAVRAHIHQAATLRRRRPAAGEVAELDTLLRRDLQQLLPAVQAQVERLWHGSLHWYLDQAALDLIAEHTRHRLTGEPLHDIAHVAQLARDCQRLLDWPSSRSR